MTAIDALRAELGLDDLRDLVLTLSESVDQLTRTKPFHTVSEVAKLVGVRTGEVDKMLADGRLWTLQGLDTRTRLIPQAAVDSLQQRPSHLKAVAS